MPVFNVIIMRLLIIDSVLLKKNEINFLSAFILKSRKDIFESDVSEFLPEDHDRRVQEETLFFGKRDQNAVLQKEL